MFVLKAAGGCPERYTFHPAEQEQTAMETLVDAGSAFDGTDVAATFWKGFGAAAARTQPWQACCESLSIQANERGLSPFEITVEDCDLYYR